AVRAGDWRGNGIADRRSAPHDHIQCAAMAEESTVVSLTTDRKSDRGEEPLRLAAEDLVKVYKGRRVVRGVSVDIRQGEIGQLLEEFGITHIAKNKAFSLSGGERRRVEIARSLAINPAFILLDEPFAGIDPIAVFEIQRIVSQLRARGIGILITDHNVRETLKITDRAYIIKEGEIFRQGVPESLSADAEVRRIYLGESFNLN